MRRHLTRTFGSLALGLLAGSALAAEPKAPVEAPTIMANAEPSKATLPSEVPVMNKGVGQSPQAPAAPAAPSVNINTSCDVPHGQYYGGAGFYLLKAHYDSGNFAFDQSFQGPTAPLPQATVQTQSSVNFNKGYEFSPLVWAGYTDASGLGFRTRWWHFDDESSTAFSAGPISAGSSLTTGFPNFSVGADTTHTDHFLVNQETKIMVWDWEVTQDFHCGCWGMQVSGGARYGRLDMHYRATANEPGTGTVEIEKENTNNTFRGIGPTASLQGKRALGESGLSLFALGRGSMLFGNNSFTDNYSDKVFITATGAIANNFAFHSTDTRDTVMPILELEMGAEWAKNMGKMSPYIRAGVVSQTWFGAGNPTTGTSGNLGLFGFVASAGLTF